VTIGELVRLTGARYSTLKYYTEAGLLEYDQAEEHLTRRYPRAQAIARLAQIRTLKAQGRTIPAIQAALGAGRMPVRTVDVERVEAALDDVRAQITNPDGKLDDMYDDAGLPQW